MKKEEILSIAESEGLKYGEVTKSRNDYPSGLGDYAILGFETFAEAEEFAEQYGLTVNLFRRRDGHQFWYNEGPKEGPLTSNDYLRHLGDNYWEASLDSEYEILKEKVNDNAPLDEVDDFVQRLMAISNALNECGEDEVVIVSHDTEPTTIDKEIMTFHEDVTTWVVGVFANRN